MCGLCPDVIGGCWKEECGALPPFDEDGNFRQRYWKWFTVGTIPCEHVRNGHDNICAIRSGQECDCDNNF